MCGIILKLQRVIIKIQLSMLGFNNIIWRITIISRLIYNIKLIWKSPWYNGKSKKCAVSIGKLFKFKENETNI